MKRRILFAIIAAVLIVAVPTTAFSQSKKSTSRTDVNLSLVGVVSTLDPFKTSLTVDLMLFKQIYESLYYIDDYAKPHGRIASSHTTSPDGLVYTFNLRKDAFFHNGDPVKASDVVFSFKTAIASPVLAPYVNVIKEVKKIDDSTVQITLKQPYTPFLNNSSQVFIVSEKAYTAAGNKFGATITGAGTGPFKVVKYDGNTRIELEAFPKYYLGEAAIKKVTFIPMSDQSTGLIAFENGELDFFGNTNTPSLHPPI
jgi:peptide/nickel transport system substrate-binding protein